MARTLLFTIPFLILFSCQEPTVVETTEAAETTSLPGFTLTDLGDGLTKAERYDPSSSRLLEEGYLFKGKKNGAWVTYHDTGEEYRIKTLTSFVNGKESGPILDVTYRCRVAKNSHYTAGLPNGKSLTFKNSRVEEEANYQNGQLHGPFKTYFSNGKIRQTGNYLNGELDGTIRYYNEDGKVKLEYEYRNGEKIRGGLTE
jgi:hypothetical protein